MQNPYSQAEIRRRITSAMQPDSYTLIDVLEAARRNDYQRLVQLQTLSMDAASAAGHQVEAGSFYIRDLTVASASGGGLLKAASTQVDYASALFATSLLGRLPVRRFEGLVGDLQLAALTSPGVVWQSTEATSTAASPEFVFSARALAPKSVGASMLFSRQLDIQAGAAGSAFVQQQLVRVLDEAADTALIQGSGASGQPTGILNVAGTTSVSGTTLGWSGIRSMITAAEGYDADGLAFVCGVNAAALLRSRETFAGAGAVLRDGRIDGIRCVVSRACPTDALLLCDWSKVVVGQWGGLELVVTSTPTAAGFQSAKFGIRAMVSMDFAVEQPAAVAKSTSIT